MSINTMKLALAALETCRIRSVSEWSVEDITPKNVTAAIEALSTAIQQPEPVVPDSSEHLRVIASLGAALRRLSFAAQTTGGTDGPDAELQSAIGQAEQALSLGGLWQAMSATGAPVAWSEREQLRHAQAAVVMPMIGPLLDAWENSDREVMSQEPELSKQLKNINSAMEDAQPVTGETVLDVRCEGCGYMTHHREHMGCVRAAKQHTHQAPSVPMTNEQWDDVLGSAGPDMLDLAKQWADNKIHVYQVVNQAEKIVKAAVLRCISAQATKKTP